MPRTYCILVLSVYFMFFLILGHFYGICLFWNKNSKRRESDAVDWSEVFAFIPPGLKSCKNLFKDLDKEEPFDAGFVANKLVFNERVKQTFNKAEERVGHTGKFIEETLVMRTLVSQPFVRTVCETGFNAGHGAFLWLQSNPNVTVFSFDISQYTYVRPMAQFLQEMFPGRLSLTFGDSRQTVPAFIAANPQVTCDVILIDGGHIYEVAKQDLENFRKMASRNSVIIYDNYPQSTMNKELGAVWENAKQKGEIMEMLRCDYEPDRRQGFSVAVVNPHNLP